MADDWSITTKGFDQLHVQLAKGLDTKIFTDAMKESLKVVANDAAIAPPQPNRMRSGHWNGWIREVGAFPRSHFFGVTGRLLKRPGKGGMTRASEKLLQKWKTAQPVVTVGAGYIIGRITNAASYGKYVQGEQQVSFHRETGWRQVSVIEQQNAERIVKVFKDALENAFK